MNVPNLFALTTQTKPSSFLANAIPSEPKAGLKNVIGENNTTIAQKDGTEETNSTTGTNATETETSSEPSQQGEEFTTFLTLLTAQIRNQDPLAPLDSTQFVEQLATFSNLELQAQGNEFLENISQMLAQSLYGQNPNSGGETETESNSDTPSSGT